MTIRPRRRFVGGLAVLGGLLLLSLAGWVYLDRGRSVPPTPTGAATPWPTFTPYSAPTEETVRVTLLITCNAPAELRLNDAVGQAVATGECRPNVPRKFAGLRPGYYALLASNQQLKATLERDLRLEQPEQKTALLFPGRLEIAPVPIDATVDIDGNLYQGAAWFAFPPEQCPISTTVWVKADGYMPYGTILVINAGELYHQDVILAALPTPLPPPDVTARPTALPVTGAPTEAPWTEEERVELVRGKLYEKVNCWRAEAGLPALPYVSEWQGLANEYAQALLTYFQQHGNVDNFDDSTWRQQFQAAGGDAVTVRAGLVMYAPERYVNTAPKARWESFNVCDPNCPVYNYFQERQPELARASGVVIGMFPWWDGDILKAAIVIGFKW